MHRVVRPLRKPRPRSAAAPRVPVGREASEDLPCSRAVLRAHPRHGSPPRPDRLRPVWSPIRCSGASPSAASLRAASTPGKHDGYRPDTSPFQVYDRDSWNRPPGTPRQFVGTQSFGGSGTFCRRISQPVAQTSVTGEKTGFQRCITSLKPGAMKDSGAGGTTVTLTRNRMELVPNHPQPRAPRASMVSPMDHLDLEEVSSAWLDVRFGIGPSPEAPYRAGMSSIAVNSFSDSADDPRVHPPWEARYLILIVCRYRALSSPLSHICHNLAIFMLHNIHNLSSEHGHNC